MKAIKTATMLTVIWNWRNFLIHSKILRPHLIAVTIDEKLSSMRMIPEASLATSVPVIPMANPISAYFKAGPSNNSNVKITIGSIASHCHNVADLLQTSN